MSPLRLVALAALVCACATAQARTVLVPPVVYPGQSSRTLDLQVRLVDAAGQPVAGTTVVEGCSEPTQLIVGTGKHTAGAEAPEPSELDLTPQDCIAGQTWWKITAKDGMQLIEFPLVQVPSGLTDLTWATLFAGATVAPGDITAGRLIPSGGDTGQVLGKTSGTDYAVTWLDQIGGAGAETDPVFGASAAAGIDSTDVTNWGAAYTASHAAASVADSTSIDLTLTGQQVSAAAIFGTASGTVAQGNHTHIAENIAPTAMVVEYGTLDSGTVAALAVADEAVVAISEVVGTPALQVVLTYTGVTTFSEVRAYLRYAGSSTHYLALEVYDYVGADWEQYGTVATSAESAWYFWPIADPSHHVSAGQAQVRIRHIQSGVTSHDLYLDLVGLSSSIEGGTIAHPDLTGRSVADAHPASAITNTPAGTIAATTVQAALNELDTDKLATGADVADLTSGTATDGYALLADGSGGAAWEALPHAATWYTWYLGNMTDAVTTGTKVRWIAPAALKISAAHGSCDTAATASSLVADVNDEGSSIFVSSEEIEIEASEKDSLDATTQPNLTNDPHSIQAGDELTFAIDTAPGGACLAPKVSLLITWD